MNTPSPLYALITAGAALFGALIGVSGALMVQRYLVATARVREKYKALRDAYASLVSAEHTYISICKNSYENDLGVQRVASRIASPVNDRLQEVTPQERLAEMGEQIRDQAIADLSHRRELQLTLNTRLGDAAEEMHRAFVLIFLLDLSPTRKAKVRDLHQRVRNVPAAYKEAVKDKNLREEAKSIPKQALDGIEDWVEGVAAELDREEVHDLEEVSWLRG